MRPPNKNRSRNKNNNRRGGNNNNNIGNAMNRVYESSGPEGRVRGTPTQVIEKYQALAHDSSLAGDRVAMENFQQHAEHYIRLINDVQRQLNERREALEAQNGARQALSGNGGDNNGPRQGGGQSGAEGSAQNNGQPSQANGNGSQPNGNGPQPDMREPRPEPHAEPVARVIETIPVVSGSEDNGGLVDTPETAASEKSPAPKPRKPRAPRVRKPVAKPEGPAPETE